MKENLKNKKSNLMREIKIEKIVLSVGGTGENLEKGAKLLSVLTGKKPAKIKSRKRIPTWGVRPGLEVGVFVTIRKDISDTLKNMLAAVGNQFRKKQISDNSFSFGIKEYLQIPGIEYRREIGIMGFDVSIVFKRAGKRTKIKKIKKGKYPKRQIVPKEEIIKFMEEKFDTKFI